MRFLSHGGLKSDTRTAKPAGSGYVMGPGVSELLEAQKLSQLDFLWS